MTSSDSRSETLRRCRGIVRSYTAGAITGEEVAGALLDVLLRAGLSGDWEAVKDSLRLLPDPVVHEVLAYAMAHPLPRLFHLTPGTEKTQREHREAEERAVAIQPKIITELQSRASPSG